MFLDDILPLNVFDCVDNFANIFHDIPDHCYDLNVDYSFGKNVRNGYVETDSAENCQLLCQTTNPCRFFSFDAENKKCWLKRSNEGKTNKDNFVSGQKHCNQKGTNDSHKIYGYKM